ncbi:hypothetical protein JTB14_015738 [Gonioctena quinquepunctata]|nr:hypothetical protein JTB14_015738 [Gonioctena quinquepunctata]
MKETVSTLEVTVANDGKLRCEGTGNIQVELKNEKLPTTICDVMLFPGLMTNLVSVSKLVSNGYVAVFDRNTCKLLNGDINGPVIAIATSIGGIYRLENNFVYLERTDCHKFANAAISDNHDNWYNPLG